MCEANYPDGPHGPHTHAPWTSASNALLLWSVPTRPTRAFTALTAPAAADVAGLGDGDGEGATAAWVVVGTGSGTAGVSGLDCASDQYQCGASKVEVGREARTDGEEDREEWEDGEGTRWCGCEAGVAVPEVPQAERERA